MVDDLNSTSKDSQAESGADLGKDGVETTPEETEGYHIIRAICAKHIDVARVVIRDTKSYCGVLLDNNNRKPLCRLRFNYSKKYIGLFEIGEEVKHPIESISEIYRYEEQLIKAIRFYEDPQSQQIIASGDGIESPTADEEMGEPKV